MKKLFALLICLCLTLVTGCSGISREDYDALLAENSKLESECERILMEKNDLAKELGAFKSETQGFIELTETERQALQAKAEAEKMNAEAEKIEAESRLKSANETLSKAEAESQRKLTEGTTVYEDEYVKINYLNISKESALSNYSVAFWVENKTNAVVTIQAECISLDGVDIGYIMMSDPVSPQSKGKVYAEARGISNFDPSCISGQLRIIDFDKKAFAHGLSTGYNADFINVNI